MQLKLQSVALGLLSCLPLVVSAPSPSMPRVDLGYEIHEAYSFNVRDTNDIGRPDAVCYSKANLSRTPDAFIISPTSGMAGNRLEI